MILSLEGAMPYIWSVNSTRRTVLNTNLFRKLKISNRDLLNIVDADIIVNSAMAKAAHGKSGSIDFMIHNAAGKEMLRERRSFENEGYLKCSECCSTDAYGLKDKGIRRVIHVNVPSYFRNKNAVVDTNVKLLECYYNVLCEAASDEEPHVVAFPLLGTGAKGFQYPAAVGLMQIGISSFFEDHPDAQIGVIISIIDPAGFQYATFSNQVLDLVNPKDNKYSVEQEFSNVHATVSSGIPEYKLFDDLKRYREQLEEAKQQFQEQRQQMLKAITESWSKNQHSLGAKIYYYEKKSEMTRKEIIEAANISAKQYNDAVNKPHHNCSFNTIIGLCVAFNLTLNESYDLLKSARMTFDEHDQGCQIIMRGIENRDLLPLKKRDQINNNLNECGITYVYVGNAEDGGI